MKWKKELGDNSLEKDLVFYKIDEDNKNVVVYAVVDGRQDYLNIIRGLGT